MFGLNFYPHSDIYHSAFRAIAITRRFTLIPVDGYRIVDYFAVNPFDMGIIRVRGASHKRVAEQYAGERPYKWTAEPAATFLSMADFQTTALAALAERKAIDRKEYENGMLITTLVQFRPELEARISEYLLSREKVFAQLEMLIKEYGIYGEGGLKDRTSLMSHRYDVKRDVVLN